MSQATPSPGGNEMPSELVRTWISLLLFIHLFMVAVAILAYPSPSTLEQRLCTALDPYLRTFNFNLNHAAYSASRMHLTHAQEHDIDFKITARVNLRDGQQEVITCPDPNLGRGLRYSRQLAYANVAGALAKNETFEAIIPRAFGAAALASTGAVKGNVMVTERRLQGIDDMTAGDEQRRNPNSANYLRQTYLGDLVKVDGSVSIIKKAATRDVAPAQREAAPQ